VQQFPAEVLPPRRKEIKRIFFIVDRTDIPDLRISVFIYGGKIQYPHKLQFLKTGL
jgi:hypothetical protein